MNRALWHLIDTLLIFYTYISHYRRLSKLFKGFNNKSYYDFKGINNKRLVTKIFDYLYIFFVLKIYPTNYYLYGFDVKNKNEFKKFIGDRDEPITSAKLKKLVGNNGFLLDDKYFFNLICKHHDLPVPKQWGLYGNSMSFRRSQELLKLMKENSIQKIVLKPRFGAYGAGIHFIDYNKINGTDSIKINVKDEYVVENAILQHSKMNEINPFCVNTIRLITLLTTNENVEILGAILRTSASDLPVDNFTMGGIVIGINIETGKLKEFGLVKYFVKFEGSDIPYNSGYMSIKRQFEEKRRKKMIKDGKLLYEHPITKIKFKDFQLPCWEQVKTITIQAQKVFNHVKSVGWDIGISDKGPVIIEANKFWATTGMQAANGGLLTDKNKKIFYQNGISFH
ncbi:sugar-transfer associated ATP-grasp domain-containing protein [Desulfosarcina widdelii]|nr:sugar-transfer associated ATP-grasp domain-containing protein [Desulfosarcina widdelii]